MAVTNSTIIVCTVNLPLARAIQYFDVGEAHMAFVKYRGTKDEYWIDSRGKGGVMIRPPETNLHSGRYIVLPYDIESGVRAFIGRPYNFRGPIARALHFRWYEPNGIFCDQLILAAHAVVDHPVCNENELDKMTPHTAELAICAYVRGFTGAPPIVISAV